MGHRQRSLPRPFAECGQVGSTGQRCQAWTRFLAGTGAACGGQNGCHFAGLPVPAKAAQQGRSCFGGMPARVDPQRNVGWGLGVE